MQLSELAPRQSLTLLLFFADALANSEYMPVRMPHVHLANIPLHVRRRPSNVETLFQATLVNSINVVHPNRYPRSLVCAFISKRTERHLVVALASAALAAFA